MCDILCVKMLPEDLVQAGWSSLQPANKQHSSPAAVSPGQLYENSSFLANKHSQSVKLS